MTLRRFENGRKSLAAERRVPRCSMQGYDAGRQGMSSEDRHQLHSGDRIGKVDTDIRDAAIYCKVCKSSIVYSPAELDYFDEVDVRFP